MSTILSIAAVGLLILVVLGWVAFRLSRGEPYATFLRLGHRRKLAVIRGLLSDRRVPLLAKGIFPLLLLYLALPFDLIPDFLPVIGHLDDLLIIILALALFLRFCPSGVFEEYLRDRKA